MTHCHLHNPARFSSGVFHGNRSNSRGSRCPEGAMPPCPSRRVRPSRSGRGAGTPVAGGGTPGADGGAVAAPNPDPPHPGSPGAGPAVWGPFYPPPTARRKPVLVICVTLLPADSRSPFNSANTWTGKTCFPWNDHQFSTNRDVNGSHCFLRSFPPPRSIPYQR